MLSLAAINALSPTAREEFHRAAEARIETFRYAAPPPDERPKQVVRLARTDLVKVGVQVVADGGENNLHFHVHSDTTWMVLNGRARFYGPGDVLLGEFGRHEGILLPGGSRYWFEKIGSERLEILQIVGLERGALEQRVNIAAHKDWMTTERLQVYAR